MTTRKVAVGCLGIIGLLISIAAQAEDLYFDLENDSSSSVIGFYVSHSGTDSWEENLIEGGYLPPGNEIEVIIGDGREVCEYDILTEFADGEELEDRGVDLCDLGGYLIEDDED